MRTKLYNLNLRRIHYTQTQRFICHYKAIITKEPISPKVQMLLANVNWPRLPTTVGDAIIFMMSALSYKILSMGLGHFQFFPPLCITLTSISWLWIAVILPGNFSPSYFTSTHILTEKDIVGSAAWSVEGWSSTKGLSSTDNSSSTGSSSCMEGSSSCGLTKVCWIRSVYNHEFIFAKGFETILLLGLWNW